MYALVDPRSLRNAADVRKELSLPTYGRGDNLARLEKVYRTVLAPDVPSYEVHKSQPVEFDEWCYTEGLSCFIAQTQSMEINAQLLVEASRWGDSPKDYCSEIADGIGDKWEPIPSKTGVNGAKVFFPPGGNILWIVNNDNVMRAFNEDSRWMLKPHPISTEPDINHIKRMYGSTHLYDAKCSGMEILRQADTVGFTTASELGLVAMMMGKNTEDFSLYEYEAWGQYHSFYLAVRLADEPPIMVLNRLINCPWSGIVPLDTPDTSAASRFSAFKDKTVALRTKHSRLVRHVKPRPQPKGAS